jgi:hypothetical protein
LTDISLSDDQKSSSRGKPPEYIFIHSHRRSGTHFLIDTISSWFDVMPGFCHFPAPPPGSVSALPNTRLVKTHEPIYGFKLDEKHLWASQHHLDEHRLHYQNNPHLYIVRNPFQVLGSQYVFDVMGGEPEFRIDDNVSLRAYLLRKSGHELNAEGKNRIEYWEQHAHHWVSRSDVLIIDYGDLLDSTTDTIEAVSQYLGCPPRSSRRPITPTGIGRGLTDRFLKTGREPVWEPFIADLLIAAIGRLAGAQPRIAPYADRWLAAASADIGHRHF